MSDPEISQKPTFTAKPYSGRGAGRSSSRALRPSTCAVGAGMIENYVVNGRTMIPIPGNARMVNVQGAQLIPAG
jgi:hypothetical protein